MSLSRRATLAGLLLACCLAGIPAAAAESVAFSPAAFEAAQKAGRSILIEVTAPWCPTCKAQKPIIAELSAKPKFKELAIFQVDFDTQKDVLRRFGAQKQSTLIGFKGTKEIGRSTGDTNPSSIEDLLNKAI